MDGQLILFVVSLTLTHYGSKWYGAVRLMFDLETMCEADKSFKMAKGMYKLTKVSDGE